MTEPTLRLGEQELEALGFCPESGLVFEGCIDTGTCVCPMQGYTRDDIAAYVAEVHADLASIRAARNQP